VNILCAHLLSELCDNTWQKLNIGIEQQGKGGTEVAAALL
jgi:hypothetical protein